MEFSLIFYKFNHLQIYIFFNYFFENLIFIVITWKCEIFLILNIVIILMLLVDIINYKHKDNEKPLSVIERWVFVGLLGWYLYIKYYKWYDYIFNFNRRMRRRKRRRRQSDKKNNDNEQIKEVRKRRSLTKKEYYDIYVLGAFLGVAAVMIINFFINGG